MPSSAGKCVTVFRQKPATKHEAKQAKRGRSHASLLISRAGIDSEPRMERLAGRFILLSGWQRLLVAFLAGALAVLAQAPYDFFVVGFISFPVLVWLLDGASPGRRVGFPAPPATSLRHRLVVRLWILPCRPLVDRRRPSCRGRKLRLGSTLRRARRAGHPGLFLRFRDGSGAFALDPGNRPHRRPGFCIRAQRVAPDISVYRLPLERDRLRGDAGAIAHAERIRRGARRHERPCGLRHFRCLPCSPADVTAAWGWHWPR